MNPIIPSPNTVQPSALAKLTLRDKLLLAQAVHEIGTSPPDWGRVSSLLLSHPLIRQPSRLESAANAGLTLGRIFGTRECERAWTALMRQRGLVLGKDELPPEPPASTNASTTPKSKEARGLQPRTDRKSQLALAQLLYAERMEELKEQIREKEEQFRNLVKEIDEIKSGKADARLEVELRIEMENLANGPPLPPSTPGSTASSVAGPGTPASTASTTPKSAKKGRARGEGSATTPGDLTKMSPASAAGSASNSAKANKGAGDRRPSIESPTKVIPGAVQTLPSTPSITLPLPATAKSGATAPTDAATEKAAPGEMTTEEAEQAVASAATEAAVKALQDEKAAQAAVEAAAEKVVETETNMELSAQAEGNKKAAETTSTGSAKEGEAPQTGTEAAAAKPAEKTKENEAPPADVVIKEKEPAPAATPAAAVAENAAPVAPAESAEKAAPTTEADSGSNKRKRDPTPPQPEATASKADDKAAQSWPVGSPVKKARTEVVPTSDVEMDSADEAEAAVGADTPVADKGEEASTDKTKKDAAAVAEEAEKAGESKMEVDRSEEEEDEDEEETEQVKSVQSKRSPAKDDSEAATKEDGSAEADADAGDETKDDQVQTSEDETSSKLSSSRPGRSTPVRRYARARASPSNSSSTVDKAAKRKTLQVLTMLLTEVSNHTHGNLFHAPIKEQDAPDYYTLIKHPLDIKTIKARIKEGKIANAKQLRRALGLMFANSLIYNRPGTEVHRMAMEMATASEEVFKRFEGTQRF